MRMLRRFAICTRGQDLVEYILLLALMVIGTTALLMTAGQSLSAVWNTPILGTANSAASTDLHGR
jgi:hypothetical protein